MASRPPLSTDSNWTLCVICDHSYESHGYKENFFRTVDDYIGCHKENDNLKCACRAFKPHLGASRRFERVLMETADRILASCEARIKRHKEKKRKEPSEDLEALIGELREFKKIYVDAKGRDEHCLLKKLNYMSTAMLEGETAIEEDDNVFEDQSQLGVVLAGRNAESPVLQVLQLYEENREFVGSGWGDETDAEVEERIKEDYPSLLEDKGEENKSPKDTLKEDN